MDEGVDDNINPLALVSERNLHEEMRVKPEDMVDSSRGPKMSVSPQCVCCKPMLDKCGVC